MVSLSVHFNQILICGPSRAGKTRFMNLLLKNATVSSQQNPLKIPILSVSKDGTSFVKMDDALLDEMHGSTKKPPSIAQSFSIDEMQSALHIPKHTKNDSDNPMPSVSFASKETYMKESSEPVPSQSVRRPFSHCQVTSTLQNQHPTYDKNLPVLNWYQFIDFGGQSQFCRLMSTIVSKPNFTIFVLDDHPNEEGRSNADGFETHDQPPLTNKEILMHCPALELAEKTDKSIKLLITGAFKDQSTGKTMDDKIMLGPSIYPTTLKNESKMLISPLNSEQLYEVDETVVEELRTMLLEMRHKVKATNVQFQWLKLYQEVYKNKFISRNELFEIAKKFGIKDLKDFDQFLCTFHDLRAIVYYPEVLPNVVFTDPQILIDLVAQLFNIVSCSDMNHLIQAARYEGIISIELLNFLASRYPNPSIYKDNFFEPKDVIKILLHLKVITRCNWKSEAEYFMPALLKELDGDAIAGELSAGADSAVPMVMFLSTNKHSRILFCSIVTSLLSLENWKIASNSENNPWCIYSNCIKLLASGCAVTLVDRVTYIEIYISASNVKLYQCIYSDIRKSIADKVSLIKIYCPCKECSIFQHYAFFSKHDTSVTCSINPRKKFLLSSTDANSMPWLEMTGEFLLLTSEFLLVFILPPEPVVV